MKPYLLFDAGGTLVFANIEWLSALLKKYGFSTNPNTLFKKTCEVNYLIDLHLSKSGELKQKNFLRSFLGMMLSELVDTREKLDPIIEKIIFEDSKKSLWTYTFKWIRKTLERLKNEGYRMSVISNSDGRVEDILCETGLRSFMERVYDSHIIGISKPNVGIFDRALEDLSLAPKDALYIGDMFYIDVLGANRAGIPAIHLDPFGFYKGWKGIRIPTIAKIFTILKNHRFDSEDFFPFAIPSNHDL